MKHETILEYWRGGSTFLDIYKLQLVHEDEIDDWIDFWHDSVLSGELDTSLKEFLGFRNKEEYAAFVVHGELPNV